MRQPLVTVVVLNWNGKQFLPECIRSLSRQTYENFYVTYVDNASTDGSADFVEKKFLELIKKRKLKIIRNEKNLGYTEGNNVGIRDALKNKNVKYVAILNNDTRVDKNWLSEMVKVAEKDKKIGSCACKILIYNKPDLIDSAGMNIYNNCMPEGRGISESRNNYSQTEEVFGAPGAALLYRREMLEDVKINDDYFDSDYFIYQEEFDLSWRALLRNWKCIYVPTSIVYHIGGGAALSEKAKYLLERNRFWTFIKNAQRGIIFYSLPNIIIYEIVSLPYYARTKYFYPVIKARFQSIIHLGKFLRKRKMIQKRVTAREIDLIKFMKKRNYMNYLRN